MHDDEPTIKFSAYHHDDDESDDTTIKLPAHVRRSMTVLENRQQTSEPELPQEPPMESSPPFVHPLPEPGEELTSAVDSAPVSASIEEENTSPLSTATQMQQHLEVPVLEYEHVWDRPTALLPTTKSSSSLLPIIAPLPLHKTKKRWPLWVRVVVSIFLLLLVVVGSTLAYGYYYFDTNVSNPLSKIIHPVSRSTDEPTRTINPIPSDSDVAGRTWNILLLGSDNDGKYSFPALLTQVMMIVHIDTINNTVTMVSIPRDSWVHVPEVNSMHKIDQAFLVGANQRNSFDDGVRLARLTIEEDYGITIDRYAWVGLSGFAKVIDTLGGVDIDVTHPIADDVYPDDTGPRANQPDAYKRLYIAPGPQHLNGLQALEYVRSRHADLVGDIGRTQRQQQVLQALKQKLNLSSILGNLQQLIVDVTGSVYTDLSEKEIIGFASFGRGLNSNSIRRITLGPGKGSQDYGDFGHVYDPWAGSNQDIVTPHCENIQPLMNRIFGLGNKQSCNVTG
ncbi:MAG: hypothetical protein NVSMB33_06020 [Ktedonobacteraceae bacterium]